MISLAEKLHGVGLVTTNDLDRVAQELEVDDELRCLERRFRERTVFTDFSIRVPCDLLDRMNQAQKSRYTEMINHSRYRLVKRSHGALTFEKPKR